MRTAGLLLFGLVAGCATAREVRLPGTQHFELTSVHTGRAYEIDVSVPDGAPPAEGWPVVYLLDGNANFPVADKVARSLVMLAKGRSVPLRPTLVVGIGYRGAVLYDEKARADDYTPPAPQRSGTGDLKNTAHGGADRFLRFLEEELKPALASRLPVDAAKETLMGHSYGGLFALHVLFTKPAAFDAYVAGSPSLWWNGRFLLEERDAFLMRPPPATKPALLVTVGGLEQTPSARLATRAKLLEERRMIDNARELAGSLGRHAEVRFHLCLGEDHFGAVLPMLRSGLMEAIAPDLRPD